jgi:hypothetical protein
VVGPARRRNPKCTDPPDGRGDGVAVAGRSGQRGGGVGHGMWWGCGCGGELSVLSLLIYVSVL